MSEKKQPKDKEKKQPKDKKERYCCGIIIDGEVFPFPMRTEELDAYLKSLLEESADKK